MTLRTELSLVVSSLLVVSIGVGGGTAIYQSSRNMRRELTTEYALFAENRAFALRDNFEILGDELRRLAIVPAAAPGEQDVRPEDIDLGGARENSVLYNTAVLVIAEDGTCLRSVPDRPEYHGQHFGDRGWFREARTGNGAQIFRVADEPLLGRTLKIVQPLRHGGRFSGALVGVVAFREDNIIAPALHDNLPPETDAVLVDERGEVVYPTDRARAAENSDWSRAVALATAAGVGNSGTLSGEARGGETLFAYAPVKAKTSFAVIFAWPWRRLTTNLTQQATTLGALLVFGVLLGVVASLILSGYLARPLQRLAEGAQRIARGEPVPWARQRPVGTEEVAALVAAFEHMDRSIQKRDQALRDAAGLLEQRVADRTRELTAAQQALVEAERFAAMGKTSAAIAHELKNTLNGLGMAVELIVQEPTNAARVARLHPQVAREIARLRDVVDSLLSFSRVPRIERAPADVAAVVRAAWDLLDDLIAERGAAVHVDAPSSLPAVCDAHKIQGVIVNLLKNAVEAGRTVRVHVAATAGDTVTIDVDDDGPGLSEPARVHLFEPFFTTKPNGTGLGLPTSRRYVEAHGGTIEASTSTLGGARFRVILPRGLVETRAIATRAG
ncbi:MAG TPA: sensor histidine kinase [Polyangia bacterium]|nr:sensor histidine kinase [Polyangia bacterium]